MFKVRRTQCSTCIYRPDSPLDLEVLEGQISDGYGGFNGHRICHHTSGGNSACCAGFWARHKDKFQMGQIAQRFGMVQLVDTDNWAGKLNNEKLDDDDAS